ncbi:MAG: 3-oxoacyl-[acyl-carrier protein] reductase [Chloroflexi bacterium]|jgi:3-oxoacyl-[acyl-carrier protein] reductase|nr:MAG: 3-oxoacyl-[acyl-carrier protein] reductase [Chloroflexota bacterium]
MWKFDLTGKVAVITGASGGIGSAVGLRLAEAGAHIVANYNTRADSAKELVDQIKSAGGEAIAVQADVSKGPDVKAMFEETISTFKKVDILINNAGIIRDNLLMRMTDEQWDEVVNTNLRSAFLCTREAIRPMIRSRWGRIVNVSSAIALTGNVGQSNYAASKAGLLGFTVAIAREVATRNITANTILPGYVQTEIVANLNQEVKDLVLSHIPLGYFAVPDDIAPMIAFLCTEEARYITGQAIPVDGGITL